MQKKCVERYCELANKTTQQIYKVSTPCIDDHHFKEEEMKSVGELSQVCSQIGGLKCLYLARIGRPDILWSVNKLARSITKWTKACDKRLNRWISYIHHTCEYRQYCHVGIQIKYIDTKNQLADILTKGNFTRDEWNHLLCLFNISHFSSAVCFAVMAKRSQKDSGEERVTAKSRPMMNLIARTPSFVSSSTSVSLGKEILRKSRSMEISCRRR